jgi:hypothetical protein
MNKELQTISMLVIEIVEKAYSNNCKHHEGPTKSKLYPNIIFTLNKKSTGQFQISPHHSFLLFENIRELKLIFRVPT